MPVVGTKEAAVRELLAEPIGAVVARLADDKAGAAAGAVAALTGALAASLLAQIARAAGDEWPEAAGVEAQATALHARLASLADVGADAYARASAALRSPGGSDELESLLDRAAEVPLRVARAAVDVAELAVYAAEHVDPSRRADAASAAILAAATARVAAHLIAVNLLSVPGDLRAMEAAALERAASSAAEAAARLED